MKYYLNKSTNYQFDEAVDKISMALKEVGFGILTEIDMKTTLKKTPNAFSLVELLMVLFPFTKLSHAFTLFIARWYNGAISGYRGVAS